MITKFIGSGYIRTVFRYADWHMAWKLDWSLIIGRRHFVIQAIPTDKSTQTGLARYINIWARTV